MNNDWLTLLPEDPTSFNKDIVYLSKYNINELSLIGWIEEEIETSSTINQPSKDNQSKQNEHYKQYKQSKETTINEQSSTIDWRRFKIRLNSQDKSLNVSIFFNTELIQGSNITKPISFPVILEHLKEHKVNDIFFKLHEVLLTMLMAINIRSFCSVIQRSSILCGLKKAIKVFSDNIVFLESLLSRTGTRTNAIEQAYQWNRMLNDEPTKKQIETIASNFLVKLNAKLIAFYGMEIVSDRTRRTYRFKFIKSQLVPIKDACMVINYISNKYNKY
jgi:hypothetical protein